MKRVGFLYNHDAAHQVAHIAGIMAALATQHTDFEVSAFVSRPHIETVARALVGEAAAARINWITLSLSPGAQRIARLADKLFPYSRLAALRQNQDRFRGLDALVSTERTCLRIKDWLGDAAPEFIYVPHGSGDRNVAYHPDLSRFDLSLFSGQKLVYAALRAGIVTQNSARVIGYPKFDGIELAQRPKLFPNENPVFLYNPHFDPHLSSFYQFGDAILEHFAAHPEWNLIFAPHVMIWKKRLHISLEYRTAAWRRLIDPRYEALPNILIDQGSPRLIDMTYTRAADVYIGDASSQVYEFLSEPRAAIFIDAAETKGWESHENYQFWHNGPVVTSTAQLFELLAKWRQIADEYRAAQERLFAYTIDRTDEPASIRGAEAIATFVSNQAIPAGCQNSPASI